MRKMELHVLKSDVNVVLERLGDSRCFQIARGNEKSPKTAADRNGPAGPPPGGDIGASLDRLALIRDFLGFPEPHLIPAGTRMPGPDDESRLVELAKKCDELASKAGALVIRRNAVREARDEAGAFGGLSLPFRELDHLSFLSVRVGYVDPGSISDLEGNLGERALILSLGDSGEIVAAASRKGRFALDTELSRSKFRAKEFPPEFTGIPPELAAALDKELAQLDGELAGLEAHKGELAKVMREPWTVLSASFAVAQAVDEIKADLESTDFVYLLEGWVPRERVKTLASDLGQATGGRVAVRVFLPEELPSVRSGEEQVPVLLKRRVFVSSFERLVLSYGAPLYGTVDPTPFVAFFFVLLFSIMFGDTGQGLVILLAGLVLGRGAFGTPPAWKQFGPILVAVGAGSMVMGFLDGSFFTIDTLFVPATRALTGYLFGKPVDHILVMMPTGGMGRLFAFFGFTIGVGVVMNSIGLVVNIVNKLRLGRRGDALFSKTGVAGALFFWWAVGLGVRVILGSGPAWFDIPGFGIPLAAIFFESTLAHLVDGGRMHGEEGAFTFIVKGFVEVIESLSYYISNTMSFLRVGAFALSHAVLSFVVFTMADLLRERAPAGVVWQLLMLVVGNLVIIVLEGMIVTIQVVRLQYYEFFSKFFTETGTIFSPFRFEYHKE